MPLCCSTLVLAHPHETRDVSGMPEAPLREIGIELRDGIIRSLDGVECAVHELCEGVE